MKLKFYLVFFLCAGTCGAFAQQLLKGRIIDAVSRQPLEAVNIAAASETGNKALTDKYGFFSIRLKNGQDKLLVSFVGYSPDTIAVTAGTAIKIAMQPTVLNLADVIIQQPGGQQKFAALAKIDLDLKPVRSSQELLRIVPGLFIAQHAGGGKAEQIFLRGFDCDHGTDIQVAIDGMPVNMVSHAHGQGYADAHFIIPETVNTIDYGTGPYYTQHGNLNTAGYVNFSTYNNIANSRVQAEAGRFNTMRVLAMIDLLKKNKDKQSAYVAGEFNYTDGPTQYAQNFNRFNIFGKYNITLSERTHFSTSVSGFKSKWDASGQIPERAVAAGLIGRFGSIDPTEGGRTERYNLNAELNTSFKNGSSWINQAYYGRNVFSLFSNFTFFLNDPVNGDGINQSEKRNMFGYNSKFTTKHIYSRFTLNSFYGAGVRYDATKDSYLATQIKRSLLDYITRGDIKETNAYAFVQQQAVFGKLLIDAGVRYDFLHFDFYNKLAAGQMPAQSKSIISPKLNIQYSFNRFFQLYVKGGKGFHSNDTRVVVANEGREILPAAYGADLGINVKPTSSFFINIAAWYLHLNQEFVYVGDAGIIEPSGKSRRQGLDVLLRYQFNQHLFANANFNFTKPRAIGEPKGQDFIPLAPTFTSTGGLFYKASTGLNGSISYRYIKDRPANEDNSIIAQGYFVADAAINYTKRTYEIGLSAENLFNVDWNEAQFATESRLMNEPAAITELHYTPGIPFFIKAKLAVFF